MFTLVNVKLSNLNLIKCSAVVVIADRTAYIFRVDFRVEFRLLLATLVFILHKIVLAYRPIVVIGRLGLWHLRVKVRATGKCVGLYEHAAVFVLNKTSLLHTA